MSDLSELAEWWVGSAHVADGQKPDADQFFFLSELCDEIAKETKMSPFFEEINFKVAAVLDSLLREATPLTRYKLRGAIDRAIMIYRNIESMGALNDLAVFGPVTVYVSYSSPERFINGLSHHERFARTYDWLAAPKELLVEALAVAKVSACLDGTPALVSNASGGEPVDRSDDQYLTLADAELVDLIATRHDKANGIIDIVKSRPTISAALVVEMLDSDQQTLLNGML